MAGVVVAVLQFDGEPVAGGDHPGEGIVGGVVGPHRGDAVPGVHLGEGVQVQEVLEDEQVVEQCVVAAGPLDLAEPEVFVLHGVDPGLLHGREVGADGVVRPGPGPHGHGVEQYADDVGQPFALAAGDGHAEDGVRSAGAGAQEEAEGARQHRVQRDAVRPGGRPQRVRPFGSQRVRECARQVVGEGGRRSGEQGGAGQAGQVPCPEAFRGGRVPGGQGPGVVLEARRGGPGVEGLARQDGTVGVEQVAQHDLARPSVPQQQVVAEQQAVAVVGQAHHGQADQRRLGGVESAFPVPEAQGVDLGVRRRLDRVDVDAAARGEDLDGVAVLVRGEARAGGRVPGEHTGRRPGQRVRFQAPFEGEVALGDVVSGRARQLGLEVQAPLEGTDGCRALGRRGGIGDPFQCAVPVLGDLVRDALGEGEGRVQAAGGRVGPGVHLDGVRAARVGAGETRCVRLGTAAQVVEQRLRPGGAEQRRGLRVEVPEAAVGHVRVLVRPACGDLARRGDGVGVRGEPYGRDGGEPADGAGVVVVVESRDPAVPFQVDREIGGRPLDAGQRGAQRAAQQLGEAEAQCGGCGAGHAVAHAGGEDDCRLAPLPGGGQRCGGAERADPVVQAVGLLCGPVRERPCVLGVGRGRRCRDRPAHRGGQVVQQDQPGHGVDGEVVYGDHQGAAGLQPGERDDVAVLRIEPPGRLVGRLRHVGSGPAGHRDLAGGFRAQRPHPVLDAEPQPQGRVGADDGARGAFRVGETGSFGCGQRPGLGEPGE